MNRTRRKLAIATWSAPREGNIFGKLTVDAEEALAFVAHVRAESGVKISITHVVAKAVAEALAASPGLNGRIHLGRYIPHDTVDMMFLIALDDGADLSGKKIRRVDEKSVVEVATELSNAAKKLRTGKDEAFEKTKGTLRWMPTWLLRPLVWLTGWLASSLGVAVPALGITEPFPFGSCVLTSVGMFGLDEAFAPHTPFARVPVLVLVGAARAKPVAYEGAVVIRHELTITATLDHRFVDGAEGARLAKVIRRRMENPWPMVGLEQRPAQAATSS